MDGRTTGAALKSRSTGAALDSRSTSVEFVSWSRGAVFVSRSKAESFPEERGGNIGIFFDCMDCLIAWLEPSEEATGESAKDSDIACR